MAIPREHWDTVPPLDAHYWLDNIEQDDPVGDSGAARDAEAEVCATIIGLTLPGGPLDFNRRVDVRQKLLGQWTDDNHTPFTVEEVRELRKRAFSIIEVDGARDALKKALSL